MMQTFAQALAAHDLRALSDADVPVDDSGFDYDRFIPGDRVEDHLCETFAWSPFDLCHRCVECDAPAHIGD